MAADGEDAGVAPAESTAAGVDEPVETPAYAEPEEEPPFYVEVWNDYDPSMRFVAIFPVGEAQGATVGSVAYYILEPGKHTGLHSDNAEEIIFVAEGEGEAFVTGTTRKLSPGRFVVLPAGMEHDIYAVGAGELRLLSFFPTPEIISNFQQVIFPMGGNQLSSRPPKPVVQELDPNNLPADFPFSLADLGLDPNAAAGEHAAAPEAGASEARTTEPATPTAEEISPTMRLLLGAPPEENVQAESERGEAGGEPSAS